MKKQKTDRDTFLFKDRINQIESSFIKDGWVTVYDNNNLNDVDETLK